MNVIYISFSPYIAKFLRKELSEKGKPIDIPANLRSIRYWKSKGSGVYATQSELRRKPTIRKLFTSALRVPGKQYPYYVPYALAFSQEEYESMPESDEKRDELVPFLLPVTVPYGLTDIPTSPRTIMSQSGGEQVHRAFIHYFYEQFAEHLHRFQHECMETNQTFSVVEAIARFSDIYDLTSCDQDAIRKQYYRQRLNTKLL